MAKKLAIIHHINWCLNSEVGISNHSHCIHNRFI